MIGRHPAPRPVKERARLALSAPVFAVQCVQLGRAIALGALNVGGHPASVRPPVTDPAWSRRPSPHDNDPDADYQYSRFRLWAEPECRLVCGPRRQRATWPGIWLAFNRSLCRLSALDAPQLQKARNSSKPSGFGANLPAGFPSSASPTQPRSSGLARPAIKFCVPKSVAPALT